MKHLDLFSGIGGFSLASNYAGFKTVGFSEIDPFCNAVLKKHWPDVPNLGDIKNIDYPKHVDLMTGGFPCQPFSVAGKRKGKEDDRYLWPYFLKIIRECRPTWVVAENVTGIISIELDSILDDLEESNYTAQTFIIPASAAGAPHRRERVWIVANTNGKRCDDRTDYWERGSIQDNEKWDIKALQQKWTQFIPQSWKTFNSQNWFGITANADGTDSYTRFEMEKDEPPISGVDDGLPNIVDRNKSLGNAIVPQVVYPILALIYQIEKDHEPK